MTSHHKKEIYNSSLVFAENPRRVSKINLGKSNGAGLVTLLNFVTWTDLLIRISKLEKFRKKTSVHIFIYYVFKNIYFYFVFNEEYIYVHICCFILL